MRRTVVMLAATACVALFVSALSLAYVGIDARPAAAANITYTPEILSGFEATEGLSIARGVNTSGQVVGQSPKRFPNVTPPLQSRAFFWDGGSIEDLGTLGGLSGAARGINDTGQIVGFSRPLDTSNQQAFVTSAADGTTQLEALGALPGFPSSEAFAINEPEQIGESGEIVGRSFLPTSGLIRSGRAFLYGKNENGVAEMDNLGVLSEGDAYSEAWAINDSGQVVGESGTDENHGQAFFYSGGTMKPLGTLDGQLYSEAFGINNSGQIVGWSYNSRTPVQGQAFIYRDGEMEELGTLPDDSYSMARAIDEHGRVVGQSLDASGRNRAFLWEDGVMTDLNTLIPADPSLRLLDAYAISESGKIVGSAIKDGVVRPFVLTPDITGPEIECGTADGLWHEEDLSISCTASDDGVGLADPADASFTLTTNVSEGTETADAPTDSREVCDAAGNCVTAGPIGGNKVDKKAPAISIATSSPGNQYELEDEVTVTYYCTDGGSGTASCSGPVASGGKLDTASVGQHTFTVEASDEVGNVGTKSFVYHVIYDFAGFFSPVDNPEVLNRVKAGSAVPVKFSLGGDQGLDIFAEADGSSFPRSEPIPCGSTDPVDRVEQTVTASSSGLTYDATTGLYTYVWKTSRGWTGCRQLVVRLDDGKEYTANFEFTR